MWTCLWNKILSSGWSQSRGVQMQTEMHQNGLWGTQVRCLDTGVALTGGRGLVVWNLSKNIVSALISLVDTNVILSYYKVRSLQNLQKISNISLVRLYMCIVALRWLFYFSVKCKKLHCWEKCDVCFVLVTKEIPQCHHEQQVPCYMDPSKFLCLIPCEKLLKCGHYCKGWYNGGKQYLNWSKNKRIYCEIVSGGWLWYSCYVHGPIQVSLSASLW